jgi:hypothetical protein
MKFSQSKWVWNTENICLLLLIMVGIYFRWTNLWDRGFINGDGAVHWKAVIDAMTQGVYHWYHAKPGHMLLLGVFAKVFGLNNFVPMAVSFTTGILCVGVVYLIGRLIYSPRAGLFAATLISISPWHIHYSRTTGSTGNAVFFWTLALLLYLMSRPEWSKRETSNQFPDREHDYKSLFLLVLSGLSMGFAFSCHYNLGILPFIFLGYEIALIAKIYLDYQSQNSNLETINPFPWKKILPNNALRIFILFSAMLFPLCIFNFSHIFLRYQEVLEVPYDPLKNDIVFSYFQQIIIQLISSTTAIWGSVSDFSFWINIIWNNEGAPIFIILSMGLIFGIIQIFKKFAFNQISIILPFVVVFIFLINSKYTALARSFALAIPLIALISGNFLAEFLKDYKINAWIWCIPFLAFIYNFPLLLSQSQISNQETKIKQYLTKEKINSLVVQGKPMYALAFKTVENLLLSEGLEWSKKQVQIARKKKLEISPSILLARFKQTDLKDHYNCLPSAQWPSLTGNSSINFELGRTNRNWNLEPQQNFNQIIGVFPLNICFSDETNEVPRKSNLKK